MDVFNLFILVAILLGVYTYYEGIEFSSLIIYLSFVSLLILYFGGKQYLRESFEDKALDAGGPPDMGPSIIANNQGTPVRRSEEIRLGTSNVSGSDEEVLYMDQQTGELSDKPLESTVSMTDIIKPFTTTPINSLAEYDDPSSSNLLLSDLNSDSTEVNAVASNEGEKGQVMSDAIKNAKMLERKFEWSNNLPPNSIVQQTQQASWREDDLGLTAGKFAPSQGGSDAGAEGFASCGAAERRREGFGGGNATALSHRGQRSLEGFASCGAAERRQGGSSIDGFASCGARERRQGFRSRKAEGFIGAMNGGEGADAGAYKDKGDNNYSAIDGSKFEMIDQDKLEAEERKILQTFQPTRSGSEIGSYNPDDVAELLDSYYSKQGKQASYYKREDGTYEVFEVTDLEPEIVYEDGEQQPDRADGDMTNQIDVPGGVTRYAATLDPFYEPRQTTRPNRSDYTAWTPGLERMFAPTEPKESWY
jgi:hypothetical protein